MGNSPMGVGGDGYYGGMVHNTSRTVLSPSALLKNDLPSLIILQSLPGPKITKVSIWCVMWCKCM